MADVFAVGVFAFPWSHVGYVPVCTVRFTVAAGCGTYVGCRLMGLDQRAKWCLICDNKGVSATSPSEWCAASTRGLGAMPSGPCVLRVGHDGPVHRDEGGVCWTDPQPATVESRVSLCPLPVITIDPAVRFGRPHIGGISCEALAGMVAAGEDAAVVADEYGRSRGEVLLACWWIGMDGPPERRKRWQAWAEDAHQRLARGEYDEIEDPPDKEGADA